MIFRGWWDGLMGKERYLPLNQTTWVCSKNSQSCPQIFDVHTDDAMVHTKLGLFCTPAIRVKLAENSQGQLRLLDVKKLGKEANPIISNFSSCWNIYWCPVYETKQKMMPELATGPWAMKPMVLESCGITSNSSDKGFREERIWVWATASVCAFP